MTDSVRLEMTGFPGSFSARDHLASYRTVDRETVFAEASTDHVAIHVTEPGRKIAWSRNMRMDLCIGTDLDAFRDIHSRPAYNTSAYYLAAFRDAIVDVRTGFFLYDDRRAWSDSCFATIQHGPVHFSPAVEPRGDERWFSLAKANPATLDVGTPVMLLTHWGSLTNYGHWLANTLVAAYQVLPELQARRLALVCPSLSDRQKRELLLIGVPNGQIIETTAQYVKIPHFVYASAVSTIGNMAPAPVCMEMMQVLKGTVTRTPDQVAPEYLYVSRLGAAHSRIMRNEDELVAALAEIGVTTIRPHALSFDAQVRAFSRARLVIGQLGAALWNLPFAPRGGAFVEISTRNYASNEYVAISQLMGRCAVQIMVDRSAEDYRDDVAFAFDCPIAQTVEIAQTLMAELERS
ncbi:glycosyltransferase family 61 protein [Methylobacterium trifolii]|uniref:Glycosyltransferase 61 catalytic domain-containing protein n=1 Tax=Methylobacterium trifolii TaxID=1003092 RepID=A0ABQ4U0D8_9HYPH|nr:glycosyltransferase 61 family protein [Methylobacterium trifolii]GJE60246.1 hypothetical protein MPOCJGCO_2357 [Methylobacterium trifolii]